MSKVERIRLEIKNGTYDWQKAIESASKKIVEKILKK